MHNVFKKCLRNKLSTVYLRDKNGKPITSYFVPDSAFEPPQLSIDRFKERNGAYFASDEHVSKTSFAKFWGSDPVTSKVD